jgi:hypothetical protein
MKKNTKINSQQVERRSYVRPAVHDQGDVIGLTKGDPGEKTEGNQIFWGDLVSTVELPQRFE